MNKHPISVPEHFKHFRDRFLSTEPIITEPLSAANRKKELQARKEPRIAPNKHPTLKALATFSG